jgi:hypothetical protein
MGRLMSNFTGNCLSEKYVRGVAIHLEERMRLLVSLISRYDIRGSTVVTVAITVDVLVAVAALE